MDFGSQQSGVAVHIGFAAGGDGGGLGRL